MKKFIALLFASTLASCCPNYSSGERPGVITKFSKKGIFTKSWEGEANLGGFRNQTRYDDKGNAHTGVVANIFTFSVQDEAVAKKVNEALESGRRVSLVYRQWLVKPTSIDTPYVIADVKSVRPQQQ